MKREEWKWKPNGLETRLHKKRKEEKKIKDKKSLNLKDKQIVKLD